MAAKILALLVAFFAGVALTVIFGAKIINMTLRYSPRVRKMMQDFLDREDARSAIVGTQKDFLTEQIEAGVSAGMGAVVERDGLRGVRVELAFNNGEVKRLVGKDAASWIDYVDQVLRDRTDRPKVTWFQARG